MTDAELVAAMNKRMAPTAALLGMRVLEIEAAKGRVKLSYEPKPEFCNPMGNVQGGFVVAMLDDAAAIAAIVTSGRRISVPTLELKTSFFAPARLGGTLFVEGRCLKLGKRVAFMEADMHDAAGTLLARMTTTAIPVERTDNSLLVDRTEPAQ